MQLWQQQPLIAKLRQQIPPCTQHFLHLNPPAAAPSTPASVLAAPTTQELGKKK
jgi:hypothetical protein